MRITIFSNLRAGMHSAWLRGRALANRLRREYLVEQYLRAGTRFGHAVSALYTGECVDLKGARDQWAQLERDYASLGYRTISTEEFIECAHGKSLDDMLRVERDDEEEAVFYADGVTHLAALTFRPLLDFGSARDVPHCHLNEGATGTEPGHHGDCNLIGCREQRERNKQAQSAKWRF